MHTLQMFSLEGRVALVTGGGHGIGRHISIGLAEAGADVIVVGRKLPPLAEVAEVIESMGRRAWVFQVDLADTDGQTGIVIGGRPGTDTVAAPGGFAGGERGFTLGMGGQHLLLQLVDAGLQLVDGPEVRGRTQHGDAGHDHADEKHGFVHIIKPQSDPAQSAVHKKVIPPPAYPIAGHRQP